MKQDEPDIFEFTITEEILEDMYKEHLENQRIKQLEKEGEGKSTPINLFLTKPTEIKQ